jgi:hypothetical protein
MQDLQINSLTRELFHKGEMLTRKDIKLFHKFIHSCGLIHIHSPKQKQYSLMKLGPAFESWSIGLVNITAVSNSTMDW